MKNRKKIHDDWKTPDWLLNNIKEEFGEFFDPCPINPDIDGLSIEWSDVNYINPPYNRREKELFINKAFEESKKGKVCIMLLPVSTSTKIFHDIIYPNAEIRFLRGRVNFEGINSNGELVKDKCGQHDSMIVIFKGRMKQEKDKKVSTYYTRIPIQEKKTCIVDTKEQGTSSAEGKPAHSPDTQDEI